MDGKNAAADKPADAKKPTVRTAVGSGFRIFVKPIVSEKTARMGGDDCYAFHVADFANKVEIKKAFAALYNVRPISVRIVNTAGKYKRSGKTYGYRAGWKKAIVRVPKGSKVSIFEGV
ncbi:MAG: 50S ribosomal protein L23 [Candidatus Micrarchaeota archaeon]|nr:50S ribosomal protein L23 [Candidatus Micrarchaeota archaeon]